MFREMDQSFPEHGLINIGGRIEDVDHSNSNGSGKTSIIDIILWVLYGITRKGGVNSVINSTAKKNCVGQVWCSGINGQEVHVVRYRKHEEYDNAIHLFVSGVYIQGADVQDLIVREIGVDAKTFMRAYVFNGDSSFATIKDTDAKSFFERLLGHNFSAWHEDVKAHVTTVTEAIASAEREVANNQTQLEGMTTRATELRASMAQASQHYDEVSAEVNQQILEQEANRGLWQVRLDQQATEERTFLDRYEAVQQQSRELLELRASSIQSTQQLSVLETRLQAARQQAERLSLDSIANAVCPTCKQVISATTQETLYAQQCVAVHDLTDQVGQAALASSDLILRVQSAEYENDQARTSLGVNPVTETRNAMTVIDSTVQGLRGSIEVARTSVTSFQRELDYIATQIEQRSSTIQRIEATLVTGRRNKEVADLTLAMFSKTGLRSFMLDSLIPDINAHLNYYLSVLTNGEMQASFLTTTTSGREKFHLTVSREGGGSTYESLSEGEKARLDLCVILSVFAKIRERIPTRFLVFDEIFDKVDRAGVDRIVGLLQEIAEDALVLVVSHNLHLSSYAAQTITVVKRGHSSTIEDDDGTRYEQEADCYPTEPRRLIYEA